MFVIIDLNVVNLVDNDYQELSFQGTLSPDTSHYLDAFTCRITENN